MFNRTIFWLSCLAAAGFYSGLALWIVNANWLLEGKIVAASIWFTFMLIAIVSDKNVYEELD